jgi:hypothetical protein
MRCSTFIEQRTAADIAERAHDNGRSGFMPTRYIQ